MPQENLRTLVKNAPKLLNRYMVQTPHEKQWAFLLAEEKDVFFGGAAGPGKSSGLLLAAAMFVEYPGYAALILRRRISDLKLPGSLIYRSHEWWDKFERYGLMKWNGSEYTWKWRQSGAIIQFGYAESETDIERYQSTEFQMIGIEEAGQFTPYQLQYIWRSLRKNKDCPLPLRMRLVGNPGGVGHDYLKTHYVDPHPDHPERIFIPAKLSDNIFVDESYKESLNHLDPITRRMYLDGDWTARKSAGFFLREWFKIVRAVPSNITKVVRYWDVAGTEKKSTNDPSFTVGVLMAKVRNEDENEKGKGYDSFYILDVIQCRKTPHQVDELIKQTAITDSQRFSDYMIREEQEPGSSGLKVIQDRARMLAGFNYRGDKKTSSKELRARPVSSQAEVGNIYLLEAPWNVAFLDQHEAFPEGSHNDIVDGTSGGFSALTSTPGIIDYYKQMIKKQEQEKRQ